MGPYLWRIPQDAGRGMRVPGLVVADDHLIESIRSDASLDQLANGTTLPGIVKAAMAMPDSASRRASRDSNRWAVVKG
jgi:tRNA-splicing ligase RtcB (3'-phosphate/5'-hydroxy nucleic acid ligase)